MRLPEIRQVRHLQSTGAYQTNSPARSAARPWAGPVEVDVLKFGLTGGLGSGKSTVANHWRARGVPLVDADALARQVVAPGSPGLAALVSHFGREVLKEGQLDRAALARLAFSSAEALAALNSITHPRIRALQRQRFSELEAAGEPLAGYEVPLLYETGLDASFTPVVVVWVPAPLQRERALLRGDLEPADVDRRLDSQWSIDKKASLAQHVIDNSGSRAETYAAAGRVLLTLCAQAGVDPKRYPPAQAEADR